MSHDKWLDEQRLIGVYCMKQDFEYFFFNEKRFDRFNHFGLCSKCKIRGTHNRCKLCEEWDLFGYCLLNDFCFNTQKTHVIHPNQYCRGAIQKVHILKNEKKILNNNIATDQYDYLVKIHHISGDQCIRILNLPNIRDLVQLYLEAIYFIENQIEIQFDDQNAKESWKFVKYIANVIPECKEPWWWDIRKKNQYLINYDSKLLKKQKNTILDIEDLPLRTVSSLTLMCKSVVCRNSVLRKNAQQLNLPSRVPKTRFLQCLKFKRHLSNYSCLKLGENFNIGVWTAQID